MATMLGQELIPAKSSRMDSSKQEWLSRVADVELGCVVDCDPVNRMVKFQTTEGVLERQLVECWSRVMGYHRPIEGWNKGKRQEFMDRKQFVVGG